MNNKKFYKPKKENLEKMQLLLKKINRGVVVRETVNKDKFYE